MGVQGLKRPMEGFLSRQFQRFLPVLAACSLFLVFHSIFGGGSRSYDQSTNSVAGGGGKFPPKIWQTWKTDATGLEPKDAARVRTWTTKNPQHRYELLTDENALSYVRHHYGPSGSINRPDIVHVYETLNAKIIRADLLRYLIMYVEGGVYADIDVECLKPIDHFIPTRYDEKDIDLVIGIETDMPEFAGHSVLGKKSQSFCQWTFMGKPRLPVMMRLIENILEWLNGVAKAQERPISQIELDFDEVLLGTGPSAFTTAVLAEMSAQAGKTITWDRFHDMSESQLVRGVLVLPSESFAAGTGHSASGNHDGKSALIKHHFHASSWPTNHPRFKHPVYGEVERCNWDPECVRLWDSNTAFFNSLPEQEQLKLVAMKEIEDARHPQQLGAQGPVGGMAPAAAAAAPIGEVPLPGVAADPVADLTLHVDDTDSQMTEESTDEKTDENKEPKEEEDLKAKDTDEKAS